MKYIFLCIGYLLLIAYLVLEKIIKAEICIFLFLWHFSINKKYYPNFNKIWVIGMGGIYDIREVTSLKECRSFYFDENNL